MTSEDDPFHDCELDPEAILGIHTFEDVLFTDDTETAQIALLASIESQVETQSKPYTAAAFFHFKATGSLERHRAYHAAHNSDAFAVDFEADYESGDLTITVERADES
ncbi:hypothetical protein [Natrinema sp. J7-2]|uniref:hypothetical protein n=1 Tax=Natrinema sp. (strain J7-2) TaxID=406552 RepID=UPI00026D5314|nr:hypothetical protein [Natrinema sp. J7-2]AFO57501.1 hypothetical protein NJ7G_2263 [Natrinema sp. J7-2]